MDSRTKSDYTAAAVDAAFAVLLELFAALGEFREHIAVIGGWVPRLRSSLAVEGLSKIRDRFLSLQHFGPVAVADFLELPDSEEREIVMRDAYERVTAFLDRLRIQPWHST